MSNIKEVKQPKIVVTLDKARSLRYDLNAFGEIEEKYGDIDAAMALVEKGNIKAIRYVLWAGLIHEDEDLTERQAGSMIDAFNLPTVSLSLIHALTGSLPAVPVEELEQKLTASADEAMKQIAAAAYVAGKEDVVAEPDPNE